MEQQSLVQQLEEELKTLKRLRARLTELRTDLDYAEKGIKVYYAVDFSEIYAYLQFGEESEESIIGVSLNKNPEKAALQYRLGLTHLFNTYTDTLYLLPPHNMEMWTYVKMQGHRKGHSEEHRIQILERTRNLDPHYKELLESLNDESRFQEFSKELLDLVKSSEFGPLCVDVSEFVNWYKRGDVLRGLMRDGKLSHRYDHVLVAHNINVSELKEPLRDETEKIVDKFRKINRGKPPNSTRNDARSLLYLRNINRLLNDSDAKMVLVTRDHHLLEVATELMRESWFSWDDVRLYIRGIETIYLDLILSSIHPLKAKLDWVMETDLTLADMQASLDLILHNVGSSRSVRAQFTPFATVGKKALDETSQLWDQHVNLNLSLASTAIPWLGKSFLELTWEENLPDDLKSFRREFKQLKNLLEYISTSMYQDLAFKDVQAIWNGIETECIRMGLLNLLGKEGADRVSRILSETFKGAHGTTKTVLRSRRFLRMPSVNFISKVYQQRLKSLQVDDAEIYDRAFVSVISEAISGLDEPEDYLFMAFVLGMIDEWSEALKMMSKCQQVIAKHDSSLPEAVNAAELDYFTSAIKRKIAEEAEDPIITARMYLESYKDILKARDPKPDDPRYMKDQAATAMLYHETVKAVGPGPHLDELEKLTGDYITPIDEAEAIQMYKRVLDILKEQDDVRLKVVILNNLAFAEVLSDAPSFKNTEQYVEQIDELVESSARGHVPVLDGVLPHINDTKVMIRARRALEDKNGEALIRCIEEFNAMIAQDDLSKAERKTYLAHVERIKSWLMKTQKEEE